MAERAQVPPVWVPGRAGDGLRPPGPGPNFQFFSYKQLLLQSYFSKMNILRNGHPLNKLDTVMAAVLQQKVACVFEGRI